MAKAKPIYRVEFVQNGQRYELYAREISQGGLFGFVEIGDFVWDTHSQVLLDPSHEKLKDEFAHVSRTFVPMHTIIRIDAVTQKGHAKMSEFNGNITPFPLYTPSSK